MGEPQNGLERSLRTDKWTIAALHEHMSLMLTGLEKRMVDHFAAVDAHFATQDAATKSALESAEKAAEKAERLATSRAEQQNEWRQTVTDLAQQMMPRKEHEVTHVAVDSRLADLGSRLDKSQGRGSGASVTVAWLIAGAGVAVGLVSALANLAR